MEPQQAADGLSHLWQLTLGLTSILAIFVHGLMKHVIPFIIRTKTKDAETLYSKFDELVTSLKTAVGGIGRHEANAVVRHSETHGKLDKIADQVSKIDRKIPDPSAPKGSPT